MLVVVLLAAVVTVCACLFWLCVVVQVCVGDEFGVGAGVGFLCGVVWCGEAVDCVSEASVVVFSVFDGITLITFRFSLPGAYI